MGFSARLGPPRANPIAQATLELESIDRGAATRVAAAATIFCLIFFYVALISLSVASIPVRGILSVFCLCVLALLQPRLLETTVSQQKWVLLLAAALAALGTFVSLANGVGPAVIGRMLLEVHVQIAVALIVGVMLAQLTGPRLAVMAFCAAIGASALVSLMQYLGLDPGWDARFFMGNLQGHNFSEDTSFHNRRPMGLSYSPIHLGTQACLAFAAYASLRIWEQKTGRTGDGIDWITLFALAMMVLIAFVSGTRSPILGAAFFVGGYFLLRGKAMMALFVALVGVTLLVAAPAIIEMMQGAENRVFRVGDNSSSGRLPLITFGLRLLADNPLGYGFDFVSKDYWSEHWREIYTMPSAGVIREAELHNYLLNMLVTYGFGLILVLPLIGGLLWSGRLYLIAFVPYVVHLIFHNTGPFWNDTLIWFVVGAIAAMNSRMPIKQPDAPAERRYRPAPQLRARGGLS